MKIYSLSGKDLRTNGSPSTKSVSKLDKHNTAYDSAMLPERPKSPEVRIEVLVVLYLKVVLSMACMVLPLFAFVG